jgi:hypothetical protein
VPSAAIVTTAPNELMATIHTRMPAILRPEDETAWLDPQLTDARQVMALVKPYPSECMQAYPVSRWSIHGKTKAQGRSPSSRLASFFLIHGGRGFSPFSRMVLANTASSPVARLTLAERIQRQQRTRLHSPGEAQIQQQHMPQASRSGAAGPRTDESHVSRARRDALPAASGRRTECRARCETVLESQNRRCVSDGECSARAAPRARPSSGEAGVVMRSSRLVGQVNS